MLKLSGEVLGGSQGFGIENQSLEFYTSEIAEAYHLGVKIALVIGGGNIFRGSQLIEKGTVDRVSGDYMGMLATVINGIALLNSLENRGIPAKLITAFPVSKIGEAYHQQKVMKYLKEGNIVIFTGGTSNPYFTTDSAAALRGAEIKADIIIKGTKVDGIYSDDPLKNPEAEFYAEISFNEVLEKGLKVMDLTAFTLCKEAGIPIAIYNSTIPGNLKKLLTGENIGSIIQ